MGCLLVKETKSGMPYPGISYHYQKWDDVHPGVDLNILDFTEDLSGQQIKSQQEPNSRCQELKGNQWHCAGNTGDKDPDQVKQYGDGIRMIQNLPVVPS